MKADSVHFLEHPIRLITNDGGRYTNARLIATSSHNISQDKNSIMCVICTDCFNILTMSMSSMNHYWSKGEEYEGDLASVFTVTLNDFIDSVEENIKELKLWVKEHQSNTDILL
jgi:hypothetical protein|tara:strand:- start:111 stop:452 length:342 start_codon:yes stop_codon:yes gene_type:complete